MANGFSAAVAYFGTIEGLALKSSNDGATSQMAEATDYTGEVVARDTYGNVIAPSCEFAVTGTVDLSSIKLGSIYEYGSVKIMLTSVTVATQAGQPPTVTFAGTQVESSATARRTYALIGSVSPRSRAVDIASLTGSTSKTAALTQATTTFSIDASVTTSSGTPVFSDCTHGRVELSATLTDASGSDTIVAASDATVQSAAAVSAPDAAYRTITATLVKNLTPTEAS